MTARAKCTASAKDLIKCFRSNEKRLDPSSYQKAEIEVLIADKEQILADIIAETPRANESILIAALDLAYEGFQKDVIKEVARKVCACVQHVRQKSQNSSSCKKLTPAVARLVQQLRDRHPSGKRLSFGSDRSSSIASRPTPKKAKVSVSTFPSASSSSAAIFAAYGLQPDAVDDVESIKSEASDMVEVVSTAESGDSDGDKHGHALDAHGAEDKHAAGNGHALQDGKVKSKPYFDGQNYVRACADGSVEKATMRSGSTGFCMVQFGTEKAFVSEVPNVFLEPVKPKRKGKAKAEPAKSDKKKNPSESKDAPEEVLDPGAEDLNPQEGGHDDDQVEVDSEGEVKEDSEPEGALADEDAVNLSWQGYSLKDLPVEAHPDPEIHKGKHSFAIRLPNDEGVIDVLMRNRTFWIKKPDKAKGNFAWNKYGSVSAAWEAAKAACKSAKASKAKKLS